MYTLVSFQFLNIHSYFQSPLGGCEGSYISMLHGLPQYIFPSHKEKMNPNCIQCPKVLGLAYRLDETSGGRI